MDDQLWYSHTIEYYVPPWHLIIWASWWWQEAVLGRLAASFPPLPSCDKACLETSARSPRGLILVENHSQAAMRMYTFPPQTNYLDNAMTPTNIIWGKRSQITKKRWHITPLMWISKPDGLNQIANLGASVTRRSFWNSSRIIALNIGAGHMSVDLKIVHWAVHLRYICFSVCILYLNVKLWGIASGGTRHLSNRTLILPSTDLLQTPRQKSSVFPWWMTACS